MHDDDLERLLRSARSDHFSTGFSARVLQRMRTPRQELGWSLQRLFLWLAPPALATIAILLFVNVRASGSGPGGLVGAALGLPAVSLDAAYTFDAGGNP